MPAVLWFMSGISRLKKIWSRWIFSASSDNWMPGPSSSSFTVRSTCRISITLIQWGLAGETWMNSPPTLAQARWNSCPFKGAMIKMGIRVNPIPATKPYPRRKPTIIILNKANVKKLLKAACDSGWYLEILLGLFCGLRKGEISGLKFGDFDAENRTIYIRRQITSNPVIPKGESKIQTYEVIEKPPKTDNSYRLLRIPEAVAKEIEKRRTLVDANKLQLGEQYFDHDYISCQENGLPHSTAAMNSALTKLCSRNGLPHITVHGLRHMYATILVEQKVPLIKISALLGHASVNTTFEYYCEVMDENEQIITFMNNMFIPEGGVTAC